MLGLLRTCCMKLPYAHSALNRSQHTGYRNSPISASYTDSHDCFLIIVHMPCIMPRSDKPQPMRHCAMERHDEHHFQTKSSAFCRTVAGRWSDSHGLALVGGTYFSCCRDWARSSAWHDGRRNREIPGHPVRRAHFRRQPLHAAAAGREMERCQRRVEIFRNSAAGAGRPPPCICRSYHVRKPAFWARRR